MSQFVVFDSMAGSRESVTELISSVLFWNSGSETVPTKEFISFFSSE
jgi:hypothetical protein